MRSGVDNEEVNDRYKERQKKGDRERETCIGGRGWGGGGGKPN